MANGQLEVELAKLVLKQSVKAHGPLVLYTTDMATSDFNNFMYMIYDFFLFGGRWGEATIHNASDIAANVSGLTEGMRGLILH